MALELTSTRNSQLQAVRRAVRNGSPTPDGLVVAEGPHLLAELQESTWKVEQVYCTAAAANRFSQIFSDFPVTEVSDRAFDSVSTTQHTQGVLTLVRPRNWDWSDILAAPALVVVLDGIQDPGNVGTIIRSAEGFGATGILLAPQSARVSNGKVLRAAAGSLFRLPFLESLSRGEMIERLAAADIRLYALAAAGTTSITDADWDGACALVVGGEGAGISPEFAAHSERLRIPARRIESLNAAVACSIALFEAARQRSPHNERTQTRSHERSDWSARPRNNRTTFNEGGA